MTISLYDRHRGWTRLEAPTPALPYWSETDDGTRRHLHDVLAAQPAERAEQISACHAAAIACIAAAALQARQRSEHGAARALAAAASRLCGEIVGLWPVELVVTRSKTP